MNEVTAVFKCSKCHMTTSKVVTEGAKYNCYCSTCHIKLDLVSCVGLPNEKFPVHTPEEVELLMEVDKNTHRRSATMSLGEFEPMVQAQPTVLDSQNYG